MGPIGTTHRPSQLSENEVGDGVDVSVGSGVWVLVGDGGGVMVPQVAVKPNIPIAPLNPDTMTLTCV